LETLDKSHNPNIQVLNQDLLNEITQHQQPISVVLDDYHEIQDKEIHHILQTMIKFLPTHIHFVITTR
jgi:LuxR family maltose regulon positive regulatory protein